MKRGTHKYTVYLVYPVHNTHKMCTSLHMKHMCYALEINDSSMHRWQGIIWLLILWVFYALLAVYLDNVLPNERGVRMPWYYCFSPNYWLGRGSATGLRRKKRTTVVKLPRSVDR